MSTVNVRKQASNESIAAGRAEVERLAQVVPSERHYLTQGKDELVIGGAECYQGKVLWAWGTRAQVNESLAGQGNYLCARNGSL